VIASVQRFASILRSHGGLALLMLAVALLVGAGAASILPDRYTATAQVLVGGTPATGRPDHPGRSGVPDTLLRTQPDIVTSGRVALAVVDGLRLAADPAVQERWHRETDGRGAIRHYAADRLLERVKVQTGAGSGLLAISFTGDDPASAAGGANGFARAYVATLAEIREDVARRAPDGSGRSPAQGLETLDATVLDAALEPVRPDGPGALLVTAGSLGAGLLLALAGVAAAEARRPGVHGAADMARAIARRSGVAVPVESIRAAFPGRSPAPPPTGGVETGTFAMPGGPRTEPLVARTDTGAYPAPPPRRDGPTSPGVRSPADGSGATSPGQTPAPAAGARTAAEPHASDAPRPMSPAGSGAAGRTAAGSTMSPGAEVALATEQDRSREPIGALLVRTGLIHPPEVERTLAWARQEGLRFGEAAIARRLLTPAQLDQALARQFHYPLLDAAHSAVSPEVVAAFDPRNPLVADLRRIRARLDGALPSGAGARCIAVIGPGPGAGRSFLAANLAVCIAQAGRRTLLVDADLQAGRQHLVFGLSNRTGLSSMLNDRIEPGALQRVADLDGLTVISCGPVAPNPSELLSRGTFGHLLASFRHAYDTVILDTGGALDEPDAGLVARQAGAALLVARHLTTPMRALEASVDALCDDRIRIAAAVFNRS
jgi:chain length determinant protein tyrosine kinase EpsG